MTESIDVESLGDRRLGAARLAIGVTQGLALYGLHLAQDSKAWPATDGPVFAGLLMALLFAPLVLIGGLGHLRRRTLVIWTLCAATVAAGLGAYAVANAVSQVINTLPQLFPDFTVFVAVAAFVFIAHHLIVPADSARRRLAPYPAYFDVGWLDAAQLGLALAFTGAFWLLLQLGASLFDLIGLTGFKTTIHKEWFSIPATTCAFAVGVHLADVRVGLTRGLRTIGLFLLSWLLPLMTLIAVGFLASLPFTGLESLWRSRLATGVLLWSMAVLIVLINAAYRDGGEAAARPIALRWAGRVTAVALAPLAVLAAFGIWLRIHEHGLTPERIVASACVLVSLFYALGYAFAAVAPGRWMRRLEAANVTAAFLILGLILALFSPLADPSAVSVRDQVARLERGRVAPGKFDFAFLRFRAGKVGLAALKSLASQHTGAHAAEIAENAAQALKAENAFGLSGPAQMAVEVYPRGATLPAGLEAAIGNQIWQCRSTPCDVFPIALAADGGMQYLVSAGSNYQVFDRNADGAWSTVGNIYGFCPEILDDLRAGRATTEPQLSPWKDVLAGGHRLTMYRTPAVIVCSPAKGAVNSPAAAARPVGSSLPAGPIEPRR